MIHTELRIEVTFYCDFYSNVADKHFMGADQESLSLWFKDVIQPKLETLSHFISQDANLHEFNSKAFFGTLLADLEHMGLDNMVVENCTERIIDGIQTLCNPDLKLENVNLRDVAKIALIKSQFERTLFKEYWSEYLPLVKKHKDINDESLINAYKVPLHIQALVDYISAAFQKAA